MWAVLVWRRLRYGYRFRRIELTQGMSAKVDAEDYERLSRYKWRVCRKNGRTTVYAERTIRKRDGRYSRMLMHRQIMGDVGEGKVIDHANGDGLDNRRGNLRAATAAENSWNRRGGDGRSGYKGVSLSREKKKWRAAIFVNGRRHHLGYFADVQEAARAYDAAARRHFGAFARVNFKTKEDLRQRAAERRVRRARGGIKKSGLRPGGRKRSKKTSARGSIQNRNQL